MAAPATDAVDPVPGAEARPRRPAPVLLDNATIVIRQAGDQYLLGEEAYRAGEMDRARRHFDAAVLVYLNSGLDIQRDQRLKEGYERLLLDIQSLESEYFASQEETAPPEEEGGPVEELKGITTFLTPDELALEMQKIRPPSAADAFSIPVVMNERVLTFIEAFQKQFRTAFVGGYQRMGQYEEMIREVLRDEGLPEDLIYVAFIESTFKPTAYSKARAKGMWQFMASTGARYGLVRNAYVDERSDPEKATRAAALYFKDLYAMFGDWYLVMAAYNAGEGVPLRAIDRTGKRDFWELAKTRYFRTETKNFVPSILALSIMSRDPGQYGYEGLQKLPRLEFDRVSLDGPTDLSLVARLTSSSVEELRRLNPHLTRTVTPPGYRAYEIRVPKGSGESFQTAYASLTVAERHAELRAGYRVRKGDTLARVGRRFGTSPAAIAEANGVSVNARLVPGMTLQVPGGIEPVSAPSGSRRRASSATLRASAGGGYVVQPGDTLSSIARRSGTTVKKLTDLNGISERAILRPGQTIRLASTQIAQSVSYRTPGPKSGLIAAESSDSDAPRKVAHKVRAGETLFQIAQRYGTSVQSLQSWNRMGAKSKIYPGDVITVYTD